LVEGWCLKFIPVSSTVFWLKVLFVRKMSHIFAYLSIADQDRNILTMQPCGLRIRSQQDLL